MSDGASESLGGPVPGRECGNCDACCVLFEIPALVKASGTRCHNLTGKGCGIYETRPDACRKWLCVWRLMPDLPEDWRPDLSGILLYQAKNNAAGYHDTALVVSLAHGREHLKDDALLGFVMTGVQNRQPIYLGLHKLMDGKAVSAADSKAVFVNAALEPALAQNDRAGFVEILRRMIEAKLATQFS